MTKNSGVSHAFLLRKLHSFTGLLPAGVFLFFHLTDTGLNVLKVNLSTVLLVFWLPFMYHILYGIRIIAHGKGNDPESYYRLSIVYLFRLAGRYAYYRNYLYLFQRVTAYLILLFILLHLLSLRSYPAWIQTQWYQVVFVLGIVSASFHFSNGLFGLLSNWGIITGEHAHKRVLLLTCFLCIGLCILGIYNMSLLY